MNPTNENEKCGINNPNCGNLILTKLSEIYLYLTSKVTTGTICRVNLRREINAMHLSRSRNINYI